MVKLSAFFILIEMTLGLPLPATGAVHNLTARMKIPASGGIPADDRPIPRLYVAVATASATAPWHLQCDWRDHPIGVGTGEPILTWAPPNRDDLIAEQSYQIQVAKTASMLKHGDLIWNSGRRPVNPAFPVSYKGPAPKPFTHYCWRVRIWSQSGRRSDWSAIANWMTGPLNAKQWRGEWISYRPHISNSFYSAPHNAYYGLPDPKPVFHHSWIQKQPCPILRRIFTAPANLRHAYVYISGLGYWKLLINGHAVGRSVLHSTLYNYSKSVPARACNVTSLLRPGHRNVITIALANGWYNIMERDVWNWQNAPWRAWPRTRLNLLMRTTHGRSEWMVTNSKWQAAAGPRLADGVYNGEVYDAALRIPGWDNPHDALAHLPAAQKVSPPAGRVFMQLMPPCRVIQTYKPLWIREPQPHVFVVKFPINMSGWVALKAVGRKGVPVVLRYGERLFANGLVNRNPIAVFAYTGPFQTDTNCQVLI